MATRPGVPWRDERGFILVGVVMFMLTLTLLGLSLFALSSYEAQFFYESVAREQSLHSTESGMEVVKTLLASPPCRLENAGKAVGQFGITRAMAYQWRSGAANDTTSSGPVNWDSTLVLVVSARSGDEERAIEVRLVPQAAENPYLRLMTCGRGISYNTENTANPTVTRLDGRVWQPVSVPGDLAWTGFVDWRSGGPVDPSRTPIPAGNAYVDAHLPAHTPTAQELESEDETYSFTLANFVGMPRFFQSPPMPENVWNNNYPEGRQYEFVADHPLDIRIRGTVVWVVDRGVCFRKSVTVRPDDPDSPGTLVIVAKANGRDPGYENRGIWFQGGLTASSPDRVQVFLVSEGDIGITHRRESGRSQEAGALSIVAGGDIELGGPDADQVFRLAYHSSMDAIATQLLTQGGLPAASGGATIGYTIARGSWLETSPR